MHDLLNDPLIGVRMPRGERRVSLPELLAALSANEVEGYTGLRAHQADPWHVFLVQLAASIQARCPTNSLPTDREYWCNGLLNLADANAWHLVVEDVTQPAFLQHPCLPRARGDRPPACLDSSFALSSPPRTRGSTFESFGESYAVAHELRQKRSQQRARTRSITRFSCAAFRLCVR
ncbi:hypothetical protein [Hydrogenophilus thermoluteolus]|uniref:Type I-E CRISPR-associated protein Cse1/CasA n=1 Tax=Hydrogenophilus thermoluteolus TaxID=297 RepID=A0A2Z6E0Q6_HYDTE|nr:hypothetical protein [Hydrogenophilus thermoluteolus]BBD78364.1 type I-E CRISPR-associated protein Cse1/CasA [Hydrogenophilus thermoluteolus]